jgi:hypothetical protein
MNLFSKVRRVAPLALIVAMALMASCSSTKKYGCPNHLNGGSRTAYAR